KLWEGSRRTCQGLKPDPGNLAVRHFRGASRTVRHGETVNPPAIERAGPETPHLQRGALDLYPNPHAFSRPGMPRFRAIAQWVRSSGEAVVGPGARGSRLVGREQWKRHRRGMGRVHQEPNAT